jgi:uncharacterized membrane protein YhaH (DUF805 family)
VRAGAAAAPRGMAPDGGHWRTPLLAWAVSRAFVIAVAIAGSLVLGLPERGVDPAVPRALALLGGWDTVWYLDIARHGYALDSELVGVVYTNLAFFPLLPGVMAAALAVGLNPFVTALVVSNLAFLAALLAVHALTRRRFGDRAAARATWVLALAPPALNASLAYTEGITLAVALATGLAVARGRLGLAGLLAAVATLARPPGLLVALLPAVAALNGPAPGRLRRLVLAGGPSVVALGAFLVWMAVARGSATLPFEAQGAWGRGQPVIGIVTAFPDEVSAAWGHVARGEPGARATAAVRDIGFGVLYLVLLARLWRAEGGLRSPWVAYSAATLALPLSSGTFTSLARFGLLAFPLAWPAVQWLEGSPRRRAWAVGAALVLTALMIAQLRIRSP